MVKKNYEQKIEEQHVRKKLNQINEMIEELKSKIKLYTIDEGVFDVFFILIRILVKDIKLML